MTTIFRTGLFDRSHVPSTIHDNTNHVMRAASLLAALLITMSARATHADDDFEYFEVKPVAGRDKVQPMKPDWCAGYKGEDQSSCNDGCTQRTLRSVVAKWPQETGESDLLRLVTIACDFPNHPTVQKQVAYFRQSWINRTGLSEKIDREALKIYAALTAKGALDEAETASCAKLKLTAMEGTADLNEQQVLRSAVCDGDPLGRGSLRANRSLEDVMWMERPNRAWSEIARAYFVFKGLPVHDRKRDDFSMLRRSAEARYPFVSLLAARMDKKALDAEIAARGLTGLAKARALALYGGATTLAKSWGDVIREGADPNLAKALQAAEAAFTGWSQIYQEHKTELDLAYAIEDKVLALPVAERSKPHAIGCEPLDKVLKQYIASKKPKTKDDIKAAATDTVGYLLLSRLVLCDAVEGHWADAAAERKLLMTGRFASGPLTAARWAAADAGFTIEPGGQLRGEVERMSARILDDHVERVTTLNEVYDGTGGISREEYKAKGGLIAQGRVATVKKVKTGIELTFKKEKWTEPDWSCKKTNRISQFQSDGTPIYFEKCAIVGSHVEEYQLEPLLFTERSASGVKIGQIIKVVSSSIKVGNSTKWESFVLEVDAAPKGKKSPAVLSYFGIKL